MEDKDWVSIIAGPEDIEIHVNYDLSQIIVVKGSINTERDIWAVCKAINECRFDIFPCQSCMDKILEKYWP